MREIYTIALAAAFALNASAANETMLRGELHPTVKRNMTVTPTVNRTVMSIAASGKLAKAAPTMKASRAEATAFEIEGNYEGVFGDYYFANSSGKAETHDCTATLEHDGDGLYFVLNSEWFVTNLVWPYDTETHTLSVNAMELGLVPLSNGETYYARIEPFVYDWDLNGGDGDVVPKDYTVTFNPATGKIAFPVDYGVSWALYNDNAYTDLAGYLDMFDIISLQHLETEPTDPNEGWTSIGNATFMDGWILPGAGIDQTNPKNWYEVELQQNDADKNVYRLVNPYKGNCPIANMNASKKNGYIQFDVTDPNHVTFAATDAGFVNSEAAISKMYCLNVLSMYMGSFNTTAQDVITEIGDEIPYTTFKDGVVSLGSAIDSETGKTVYDAVFGDQTETFGGFTWGDGVNMTTKIFFPGKAGIENVSADASADAPVRYYNLQGQPVATPAVGTLVIRQQGDKVEKLIIR